MTNWRPEDPDMYEDVQTRWQYANNALNKTPMERLHRLWRSSRDSARTLVQWDDSDNGGFTTSETPWFYVNPNYVTVNVASQEEDPESILNFYRKAIALRKELSCVRYGRYTEHLKNSKKLFVYSMQDDRQKILVVCSFSDREEKFTAPKGFHMDHGKLILGNYENSNENTLKPYEARVYLWK